MKVKWPRRRFWLLVAVLAVAIAALVEVTITGPRISVRWAAQVDPAGRRVLEERYHLRNGQQDGGPEWRYELQDWSSENIGALLRDPAVADTLYIDRKTLAAEEPDVRIAIRNLPFPLGSDAGFRDPSQLFQFRSLCLLLAGAALLSAARIARATRRRLVTVATLLVVAVMAYALPLPRGFLRMGDAGTYTASQQSFEQYVGLKEIRYEAHLSHAILGRLYDLLGRTADSPTRALTLLMRGATAWFVLSALCLAFIERWSPLVVRYLGLALLAPSALLYFGYQELGYLSLNVAAFPLLARGLRAGDARLEGGSALFGLGAALHGFGLLSIAGSWLAAFAVRGRFHERLRLALRILAWGTATYIGWTAVYLLVLKIPIVAGHADAIPWRPFLADEISPQGDRLNAAILSVTGGRDLLFEAWVVGVPILAVVASLWRRHRDEVRVALCYTIPSMFFLIVFWPIQGLGPEMDLVVAAFPAVYALAWVCAHEPRHTVIAAALLVSAHLAFWRIVLDERFVN